MRKIRGMKCIAACFMAFTLLAGCGKAPVKENNEAAEATTIEQTNETSEATEAEKPDEHQGQVIVTVKNEIAQEEAVKSIVSKIKVILPGNESVADKINDSDLLKTYYQYAEDMKNASYQVAQENNYEKETTAFELKSAQACTGIISLMFGNIALTVPYYDEFFANFDLETGDVVEIRDILDEENNADASEQLKQAFKDVVTEQYSQYSDSIASFNLGDDIVDGNKSSSFDYDYGTGSGTTEYSWKYDLWGFTREGLTIAASPAEINDNGWEGTCPEITVPYSKLSGIIKEKYLPVDVTNETYDGDISVEPFEEVSDAKNVYGNGTDCAVTVSNSKIRNVCIGEAYLYDEVEWEFQQVRISRENVQFYANYLLEDDAYGLSYIADETEKVYIVKCDKKSASASEPTSHWIELERDGDGYNMKESE